MAAAFRPRPSRALAWGWLGFGLLGGVALGLADTDGVEAAIYAVFGGGSLILAVAGLRRHHGRVPLMWKLLLGGATLWFLGDSVWTAIVLAGGEIPFPSPVDALYFASYPVMFAGVVVAWRTRTVRPLGGLLDTVIVAVAGGLFVWTLVSDSAGGAAATAMAVAYPTCDIAMVAAIGQLLAVPSLRRVRSVQALAAALGFFFVGDTLYAGSALGGGYTAGSWVSVTWLCSFLLLGFSGLHPGVTKLGEVARAEVGLTPLRLGAMALASLLAPAALALQVERQTFDPYAFAIAGSLLVVLVFSRMALLFREQQRAEAELRASGELYRALVEQSGDMVALLGSDGRIAYASAAHEQTLGWAPSELVGSSPFELLHPEERDVAASALEQLLTARGGAGAPLRLRRRDGDWVWVDVRASAIRGRDGERHVLLSGRDVTERHQAARELKRTSTQLQTLVDTAPVAIVGADCEGRVTLWNPCAEELFGWRADEVLGRTTPLLEPDQLESTMTAILAGERIGSEQARPRKDGSSLDVLVSAAPVFGDGGAVSGLFAVFLDVSERNRLEEQLRQAQRLEAIGQLAGGVAHDFNNLLTAISGYRELALRRAEGDESLRRQLNGIGDAAGRAAELTRQLLAFSRRQLLQPSVFDLNVTVEETRALLQRVLGAHIEVVTRLDPAGCPIRADQGQVEHVLMNLAVNARDAMPEGGTLTIETARDEDGRARLRVTDTGCGMDEETLGHAFDPFFTTKPLGKGTGLGLSTVYGIVTQSGGTVAARSVPGEGTTFEVALPLSRELPEALADEPAPAADGSERVLLVEDEPVVRELTREMLEDHGYDVVCAERAERALELAQSEHVDVLVTDVVMPGMNGRALAQALRADRPDLRVLYTSGYSDDAALQGGRLEPLASFLQKPYSSGELGAAVRKTLDAAA